MIINNEAMKARMARARKRRFIAAQKSAWGSIVAASGHVVGMKLVPALGISLKSGTHERAMWARAKGHVNRRTPGVLEDLPYELKRHHWIRAWNEILCSHCRVTMERRTRFWVGCPGE